MYNIFMKEWYEELIKRSEYDLDTAKTSQNT